MPLVSVSEVISVYKGSDAEGTKKEDVAENLIVPTKSKHRKLPSYLITNAFLRKTMHPVAEIKLYKVVKSEEPDQHYVNNTFDQSRNSHTKAFQGKKKTLVGSEYTRYFLGNEFNPMSSKETKKMARKEIAEEFQKDDQRLAEQLDNLHRIVAENRKSSHVTELRAIEEKRRGYIEESNIMRSRVIANPLHLTTLQQDNRSKTEIAEWVLKHASRLPMKEIEHDLFQLDATLGFQEDPATDSSEDEDEDEEEGSSGKIKAKTAPHKLFKRGDAFNILDMDIKCKLEKDLDKLDQNLTKELIKRMKQKEAKKVNQNIKRTGRKGAAYFVQDSNDKSEGGDNSGKPSMTNNLMHRKNSTGASFREGMFRLESLRRVSVIPSAPSSAKPPSISLLNKMPSSIGDSALNAITPDNIVRKAESNVADELRVIPSAPSSSQRTWRSPRAQQHIKETPPQHDNNCTSECLDNNSGKEGDETPAATVGIPKRNSDDISAFPAVPSDSILIPNEGQSPVETKHIDDTDRLRKAAFVMDIIEGLRRQREKIKKTVSSDFTSAVDEKLLNQPPPKSDKGTLYFVSPIHTVTKKECNLGENNALRPMPYREKEMRTTLKLGSHDEVHVKNDIIIRDLDMKNIYPELSKAARNIDETSTAVIVTRRARNAIAKDLNAAKEVCHKISKHSAHETRHLVHVCRKTTKDKAQHANDFLQELEERKFTAANKMHSRRKQFATFDDRQSDLLSRKVVVNNDRLTSNDVAKSTPKPDPNSSLQESLFITQMNSINLQQLSPPTSPKDYNKIKERNQSSSPRRSISPKNRKNPSDVENDYRLLYDYDSYFRSLVSHNQKLQEKSEKERVLSKQWYVHLLKKIQVYKKSVSYSRVPESLLLLLAALKKLISIGMALSKESVWLLIDKTIQKDEFKSNLVYNTLQAVFNAVGVSCEEVYRTWNGRQIECAPQLLVNVKRLRKTRWGKAKNFILAAKKPALLKQRVLQAFMTPTNDNNSTSICNNSSEDTTKMARVSRSRSRIASMDSSIGLSMTSVDADQLSTIGSEDEENEGDFDDLDVDKWL